MIIPAKVQYVLVEREVIATLFKTRAAAQRVADVLNENEGPNVYVVEFRDRDQYSIIARTEKAGTFLGYVKTV